jgi:acetyl esterase/lipase
VKARELPAFFDELAQWAAAHPRPVETVAYGEHADQVIDLRRPSATPGSRLALVLHGGFWRAPYTRRNTAALSVALAEAGWASANVEYRRLGPGRWRPMLDDVLDARRSLDAFDHVVAIGHSAGGHLALWLAAQGAVDAAVGLGAVCDLAAAAAAGLGDGAAQELLGGEPDDVPDAYRAADPAAQLPLGVPQVLIHGGDDDRVPVSHARAYAERARASGDDCRVFDLAGGGHFEPIDPRSSAWPHVRDGLEAASAAARPGVTT